MPLLPKSRILEFQRIMQEEYHVEMTEQEAATAAVDILNLFTYLLEIHLDDIEPGTD